MTRYDRVFLTWTLLKNYLKSCCYFRQVQAKFGVEGIPFEFEQRHNGHRSNRKLLLSWKANESNYWGIHRSVLPLRTSTLPNHPLDLLLAWFFFYCCWVSQLTRFFSIPKGLNFSNLNGSMNATGAWMNRESKYWLKGSICADNEGLHSKSKCCCHLWISCQETWSMMEEINWDVNVQVGL